MVGSVLLEVGVATVQVLIGYLWPVAWSFLVGTLGWYVRKVFKSRTAARVVRALPWYLVLLLVGESASKRRELVTAAAQRDLECP